MSSQFEKSGILNKNLTRVNLKPGDKCVIKEIFGINLDILRVEFSHNIELCLPVEFIDRDKWIGDLTEDFRTYQEFPKI